MQPSAAPERKSDGAICKYNNQVIIYDIDSLPFAAARLLLNVSDIYTHSHIAHITPCTGHTHIYNYITNYMPCFVDCRMECGRMFSHLSRRRHIVVDIFVSVSDCHVPCVCAALKVTRCRRCLVQQPVVSSGSARPLCHFLNSVVMQRWTLNLKQFKQLCACLPTSYEYTIAEL